MRKIILVIGILCLLGFSAHAGEWNAGSWDGVREIPGDLKLGGSITFPDSTVQTTAPTVVGTGFIPLPVQAAKLTGNFVTQDDATQGAAIDAGEGGWRLLFDASTDEGAIFQFRMPNDYASNLVAKIGYSMNNATSGTVEFEVAVMAVSDGESADIVTASFDTQNVGSATVPGTTGYLDEISIILTNADSVAAGDLVFIQLSTDANDGTNDTAANDREVAYFQLEYDR